MIKLEFRVPNLGAVFKKNQYEILQTLAATMQTNRAMMFDKDGADNGKPKWAPLNPMFRTGRPLQKTGTLRKSMAPVVIDGKPGAGKDSVLRIQGPMVTIGTKLLYAGMMNDGTTKMPDGVLRPVKAQALKIPLEDGSFMFRKSVKIPARPMNIVTEKDKAEFSETVANHIADLLNRKRGIMKERIEEVRYKRDDEGIPFGDEPFISSPAEFLIAQVTKSLLETSQWKRIFGENITPYKRMDFSMRALPALRIYNDISHKDFESWWVDGDLKADIILPAVLRRDETQQVQDTLSMALLQQFRRPKFFDHLSERVPGLNQLGKQFSVDKTLGFDWEEQWVPLTQIVINFRIDLRIWDDYLEETDRTKDSPFEKVLANLDTLSGTIKGLQDDLVTTDVELGINQTPGTGGDE